MLTFLGAVLRVSLGFALACLAAGLVQALFAVTPSEIASANDDRMGIALTWGLQSATLIGLFAAPFALIAIVVSEWQGLRSFAYHALVAMSISTAGFGLLHSTESATEASIVNSYAMAAFLTSGFVGGLVYWLFAGHWAGKPGLTRVRMENDRTTGGPPPRERQPEDRVPRERQPEDRGDRPGPQDRVRGRLGHLSDRLLRAKPESSDQRPDAAQSPERPTENARMAQHRSTGTVPATRPRTNADVPPSRPPNMPKPSGSSSA